MKKLKYFWFLPFFVFLKNPFFMNDNKILNSPSLSNILGTDNFGRDIFSRLVFGTFNTIMIVIASILLATIIGFLIGAISGYFGSVIDTIYGFLLEIILSIPSILIAISVVVIFGHGYFSLIVSIILMYLPLISSHSRALVIKEKNKEYIVAAKTYGVKSFRIILRHIYPNIKEYIIVNFIINFSKGILTEASLGFLGIGVDPYMPTLGNMLNLSFSYFLKAPWFALSPGITIVYIAYLANKFSKKKGTKGAKRVRN